MKLFALITALFLVSSAIAKPVDYNHSPLSKKIDNLITHFGEDLNIGILVKDVNTGKILYKKNSDRYFNPASNEKLFTGFAALHYLGPQFTYQTRLFIDTTELKNKTLKGNAYLEFSGDPSLTVAQLNHLLGGLSQKGIQRIDGRIVVDDSAFDQVFASPGTGWDDKFFGFGAPISALIIDRNNVRATLLPAEKPNQLTRLTLPNQPQFMYFVNRAIMSDATTDSKLDVTPINETTYLISGSIKSTGLPKDILMSINAPRGNTQLMLNDLLKKNQITHTGPIEFQKINMHAETNVKQNPYQLIAYEVSPPLSILVKEMLKESDNTIADALFKTMGSVYSKQNGSWENGSNALHSILGNSIGLTMPKPTLIDGSGRSRYNYITPQQIVTLLYKAYLSKNAAPFFASLPISGIDGTLKDRMNNVVTRGKIHAKTGSETGVTALSGYAETQKKHTLVFSILINGFIDSSLKYKALEDKICTVLVENG